MTLRCQNCFVTGRELHANVISSQKDLLISSIPEPHERGHAIVCLLQSGGVNVITMGGMPRHHQICKFGVPCQTCWQNPARSSPFGALQLQDEGVDVVGVRRKTLAPRRRQVCVAANRGAEEALQGTQHLSHH